jgi:hypothetical protein
MAKGKDSDQDDKKDTGTENLSIGDAVKEEQPHGREKVTIDDVVKKEKVRFSEPGPLTRIGFYLAIILITYLSVVTLILLAYFLYSSPAPPKGLTLCEAQLDQYKQLSEAALDRTMKLLDALVLKGFLPVLTAVLGYIFGTRGADRETS